LPLLKFQPSYIATVYENKVKGNVGDFKDITSW